MVAEDRLQVLWSRPEEVAAEDVAWLEAAVVAHPASLPHWWLYLRAIQRAESPKFAHVLQRCAALSPNRAALMAWVEQPLVPVAPEVGVAPAADALPSLAASVPESTAPAVPAPAVAAPVPAPAPAPAIDLDALPEKVREQILRARALKAKLSGNAAPASDSATAPAPTPIATDAPSQPATVGEVGHEEEVIRHDLHPEKAKKQDRTSNPRSVPKQAVRAQDAIAPTGASSPASSAEAAPPATAHEQEPDLSPFAKFVAQLAQKSAPSAQPDALIDQFLQANPRIAPLIKDAPAPEVRTQPDAQVTGLVTETLARLYAEQGHVAKAIQAYEILKLRVPEKSSIFAARIEALRNQ